MNSGPLKRFLNRMKRKQQPKPPSQLNVKYLTGEQIMAIHYELVEVYSARDDSISPPGERQRGMAEAAAARPKIAMAGYEKYTSIEDKAAALFHSLVTSHPFHNGNKRTALVALLVFLNDNKRRVDQVSDDDVFEFVVSVADNSIQSHAASSDVDDVVLAIADWIRKHTTTVSNAPRDMRIQDFLDKCQRAGASYRKSKGGWLINGPNDSIKIQMSTRRLSGPVAKRYVQQLGLAEGATGHHFDEFHEGLDPSQALIRRFRNVLDRLAHA